MLLVLEKSLAEAYMIIYRSAKHNLCNFYNSCNCQYITLLNYSGFRVAVLLRRKTAAETVISARIFSLTDYALIVPQKHFLSDS